MTIKQVNSLNTNKYQRDKLNRTSSKSFSEALNQASTSAQRPSFEAPNSLVGRELQWNGRPGATDTSSSQNTVDPGKLPESRIGATSMLGSKRASTVSVGSFESSKTSGRLKNYGDLIEKYAAKYDLDPNLVAGVMEQESNYNAKAVSHCGAQGLMQLMPNTARLMGVKNSFDPEQNIEGGTKYLRKMLDRFDGDLQLALAAYNSGPANVEKYGNRIPPFKETQHYVKAVTKNMNEIHLAGIFSNSPSRASIA